LAGEDQNYKGQLIEFCHCNSRISTEINSQCQTF